MNNTITVINRNEGNDNNSSTYKRSNSKVSAHKTFATKNFSSNGLGGNIFKNIKTATKFNAIAELSRSVPAIAIAVGSSKATYKIYKTIDVAKSGEAMKWRNLDQNISALVRPINYFKTAIYNEGYLRNLQLSRQNEMLEYNKKLTGSLVYSQLYQNTDL